MTDQTVPSVEQPDHLAKSLAERAQVVADLHAFADFLGRNSWAPLPYMRLQASVQTNADDVWHGGDEGVAELRRIADALGKEPSERLDDRTEVTSHFGSVEYHVVTWHRGGRPGEVEKLRAELAELRKQAATPKPLVSDTTIAEAAAMEARDREAGGAPWEVADHPENAQPGGWHHGQIAGTGVAAR